MKNIQIIDDAANCTFSIFQATDEEFALIFPGEDQEIQFSVDFPEDDETLAAALENIWNRPIRKRDALGIHGTIFYGLRRYKKTYPVLREDGVTPLSISPAQREHFAVTRTARQTCVHILWHIRPFPNGNNDEKLLGVYSSEATAKEARTRLAKLPGFNSDNGRLEIANLEIDRDQWPEGFITVLDKA
ncbi:MAG: hypothetical protein V2I51_03080 [Anderseniella sp.]|jgi:hypothetical protein|nr:hypothetical protein [Anderseniella sp.]